MGEPLPFSRIFLARLGAVRRAELATSAELLEPALRRLDAIGRAAWPQVALEAEVFVAHLARAIAAENVHDALAAVHAEDLFLACACSCGVPSALCEFERVHLSRVAAFVRRIDASATFADDVAQSIRETFLVAKGNAPRRITEYSGRGALSSWVRVIAVRTALRLRREQHRKVPEESAPSEPAGAVDPELDYLKLRYRGVFEEALRTALATLPDRDALFLELHYVDGLNIDRIGALYGMHRSTVARWRTAVRRRILAATRQHLRRSLSLTDSEFDSLAVLVRSQLAVSLRTALHRPA